MWDEVTRVFAGDEGLLYGVKRDGSLVWYRHTGWEQGDPTFASGGAEQRFRDDPWWGTPITLDGGSDGTLYGVGRDGSLLWQRHQDWRNGSTQLSGDWRPVPLTRGPGLGGGWAGFVQVLAGSEGVLYGVKADGSLVWYRHTGWQDGSPTFADGGRERVLASGPGPGGGWASFARVVAGSEGVLYGIKADGSLVWYRHTGWQDGSPTFADGGRERVLAKGPGPGGGWAGFRPIGTNYSFEAGYALDEEDATLERHRYSFGKVSACTTLSDANKRELFAKYERPIVHGTNAPADAWASAPIGGERIDINVASFFSDTNSDDNRSQTLIHEMVHLIGEEHPDRRDPPDPNADSPNDGGPYYGSAPLQAELCIAGTQNDTRCDASPQGCVISPENG